MKNSYFNSTVLYPCHLSHGIHPIATRVPGRTLAGSLLRMTEIPKGLARTCLAVYNKWGAMQEQRRWTAKFYPLSLTRVPSQRAVAIRPTSLHTTTLQIAQQTKDAVIPALSDTKLHMDLSAQGQECYHSRPPWSEFPLAYGLKKAEFMTTSSACTRCEKRRHTKQPFSASGAPLSRIVKLRRAGSTSVKAGRAKG